MSRGGETQNRPLSPKKKKISFVITLWLILIILATGTVALILTGVALNRRAKEKSFKMVRQHVEDASSDIDELADESILKYVKDFIGSDYIQSADIEDPEALSEALHDHYEKKGIEINVVNSDGIIIASSNPDYIGYDMHDGEQSSQFLVLLDGDQDEYIQDIGPVSYNDSVSMKYAGIRFPDGSGFLEVGMSEDNYYETIWSQARYVATNRRIDESGYLLICSSDFLILDSYHNEYTDKSMEDAGITIDPDKDYSFVEEECDVFGIPSYVVINEVEGLYIVGVFPISEAASNVVILMKLSVFLQAIIFGLLFVSLRILIKRVIVYKMKRVNNSLAEITSGNLEEKVDVRDTLEFDVLSTDINMTVDRLKDYIAEAAARIDEDLIVAKTIQSSALPGVFPPFPEHREFELFASMEAAKEVGGDFYDFYMLGSDTLAFLIADVSGKSIPGAMFMMRAKSVIKDLAERGLSPAEAFTAANTALLDGNKAEMFVTAWMGYLELKTGTVYAVNAGHNPPVLIRGGHARRVIIKSEMMLAGAEGSTYQTQELKLRKGDILYLYTDGVTEAMDPDKEQYGEKRLLELLTFGENYPKPSGENGIAGAVCEMVMTDVREFAKGAEQSDDITMLCLRYK